MAQFKHRCKDIGPEKKGSPHIAQKGIALLLSAVLSLSLLPSAVLSAAAEGLADLLPEAEPVTEAEETAKPREPLDEETLTRLRAGLLTSAEVDALIEQGLTVADLGEDYPIMPMGLVEPGQSMREFRDRFKFLINVPREEPKPYDSYIALSTDYTGLESWDGPKTGPQADENTLVYYTNRANEEEGKFDYYPKLTSTGSAAEGSGVDYEVTRLSYHDTTVYRIGYLEIETADGGKHTHLYASPEVESGTTSHFVLPDNAQITVEYSPIEYDVEYEITGAPEGWGPDRIFGANRPLKTTNQHVSTTVTIPVGYTARVYFNNVEKFPMEDADSAVGDPISYGNHPLGTEPKYKTDTVAGASSNVVVIDTAANAPDYFSLTGTYLSGKVGSANSDIKVRVELTERTSFTLSDELWVTTSTGGSVQTEKILDLTPDPRTKGGKPTTTPTGDGFIWTFTTYGERNGEVHELRTLTVNGQPVSLPPLPTKQNQPSTKTAELKEADFTYANVNITVAIVQEKIQGQNGQINVYKYTVEFSNVKRDLVITTSALVVENAPELVVSSLEGVELELWSRAVKAENQDPNYDWNEADQGRILKIDEGNTTGLHIYDETDSNEYNARFRPAKGYEWGSGGVDRSITFAPGYTLADADSDFFPDEDGWYYATLTINTGAANSAASYLSIEAELKQYQVHYLDGTGQALQNGVEGMPTSVTKMPFSDGVDTNGGKYYDMITNKAIVVNSDIPEDNSETADKRPAVFLYWVLTDAQGNPIDPETGNEILDYKNADGTINTSKLHKYKGAYTADLSATSAYADKNGGNIYLTAYWEPAAQPFVYYITLNKIDSTGAVVKDVAEGTKKDGGKYEMPDGRYAFVDRETFTKVPEGETTFVIFDTGSEPAANFLAGSDTTEKKESNVWYKFDELGQYKEPFTGDGFGSDPHNHIYEVGNHGEVDVWLYYTLGGLTIKNDAPGASDRAEFTYRITFRLPADDPGTDGDETLFFNEGYRTNGTANRTYSAPVKGSEPVSLDLSNNNYTGDFTLKGADGFITFEDLPAGTTYTVTQTSAAPGFAQVGEDGERETEARSTNSPNPDTAHETTNHIAALYDDTVTFTNEVIVEVNWKDSETVIYNGTDRSNEIKGAIDNVMLGGEEVECSVEIKNGPEGETGSANLTGGRPINAGIYTVAVTVNPTDGAPITVEETFTVQKAEPDAGMFDDFFLTFNNTDQTAAVKPDEKLKDPYTNPGGTYSVAFSQEGETTTPKDAGSYTVTITVNGNGQNLLSGTVEKTLTINRATIQAGNVSMKYKDTETTRTDYVADTNQQPTITVTMSTISNEPLKLGVDYTVDWNGMDNNFKTAGEYPITVEGIGNYQGTVNLLFTIGGMDIAGAEVNVDDAGVIYNGQDWHGEIYKYVTVTGTAGTNLVFGTDYRINTRRTQQIDADTYYIQIQGLYNLPTEEGSAVGGTGGYSGTIGYIEEADIATYPNDLITFTVHKASLDGANVTLTTTETNYNGSDMTETVKGYVQASLAYYGSNKEEKSLSSGTDFDVISLTNVKNAGKYTITIQGKGNFEGSVTKTDAFEIKKLTPTANMFTVSPITFTYNKQPQAPTVTLGSIYGDATVTEYYQKDGSTEWKTEKPVDAGTYAVKISVTEATNLEVKDDLTSSSWNFTINPRLIDPKITFDEGKIEYDGTPKTPGFTVTADGLEEGDTLVANTDYIVGEYQNNTDAGNTASVTITAVEGSNYTFTGEVKGTFTIAPKPLILEWPEIDLEYTGRQKEVTAELDESQLAEGDKGKVTVRMTSNTGTNAGDVINARAELEGDRSGNYTLTNPTQIYTIAAATPRENMFDFVLPAQSSEYNRQQRVASATLKQDSDFTVTADIIAVYFKDGTRLGNAPTDAGTYTVQFAVTNGSNLANGWVLKNDSEEPYTYEFTIEQATPTATVTTFALTYNGEAQELISEASFTGDGQLLYALGNNDTTVPGGGYSIAVPKGTNYGTYYVWYKAEATTNYKALEPKCVTVTIEKATITSGNLTLNPPNTNYTGNDLTQTIKDAVTVQVGNRVLTADTDYDIKIESGTNGQLTGNQAINAGDYKVTVTGKGNYDGEASATFTINALDISSTTVSILPDNVIKSTTSQPPENVTVTMRTGGDTTTLRADQDYTLEYFERGAAPTAGSGHTTPAGIDYTNAGDYPIRITGIGNYTGSRVVNYHIGDYSIMGAEVTFKEYGTENVIDGMSSATYNGQDWNKWDETIGDYRVEKKVANTISVEVTEDPGAKVLTYAEDYYIEFVDFDSNDPTILNAGKYKIRIVGMGAYSGVIDKFKGEDLVFEIRPFNLNNSTNELAQTTVDVTFEEDGTTYNGTNNPPYRGQDWDWIEYIKLSVVGTYEKNTTNWKLEPVAGTDFDITEPTEIIGAGSYDLTIEGKGNYTGELKVENAFTIDPADLSKAAATAESAAYNGQKQTPTVTVTMDYIGTLTEGTDYTIDWGSDDYIKAGDHTFTIEPKSDNFENKTTGTFKITPVDLSEATVTLSPTEITYDGKAHAPTITVKIGDFELSPDDYEIDWGTGYSAAGFTNVGTYTITIKANGDNCEGEQKATFTIKAAQTSNPPSGGGSYPSGGGSYPSPTYPPNVVEDNHGNVTTNPSSPKYGDKTTVWPEPEPGYTTGDVVVKDRNGNELNVTDNGDGSYSFVQPNGSVTIDVEYVCTRSDEYCPVASFDDVSPRAWYHDGVHYCVENGLLSGIGDNLFDPNAATTRAMIATILWRIEGNPAVDYTMNFDDVADGEWYTEAIRWAASKGVVQGEGNDLFNPDNSITREQMAAMLYRYAEYKGIDVSAGEDTDISSYDDASSSSTWAMTALQWAVGSGLITGRTTTTIVPRGTGTRAEAATIFQRFCTEISD